MTKVDIGETQLTVDSISTLLRIYINGPEGGAVINVSETWVRKNLKVFDTIRKVARFIPGGRVFLVHATKVEKAIEEELGIPPN